MPHEEIRERIFELQKIRWRLVCNPEWSEHDVLPAAMDWLTSSIAEHLADLDRLSLRKTA